MSSLSTFEGRHPASNLAISVMLIAAACAAPQPQMAAEEQIGASIALDDAVVFHMDDLPLDAPVSAGDALPLQNAVRRAIETSPELQAALARVRMAEAEAELAALLPNPILAFALRFPEGGGGPDFEGSLSADLLSILQRPRRSSAAVHRLEAEAASALSAAIDVVAEAQELYASAQALEELARLIDARVAVFDRLREVMQARLELGEGTRHDVSTLDAERMDLAVEASQRRRELRLARLALARRIGEPSAAGTWQLDPWHGPAAVPTEESAWIRAALGARPEVLAVQWEIRARADESALAGSDAWSGLGAGIDAEESGDVLSIGPAVSAPVPVFDRGSARERKAEAAEWEARHRLVAAQRGVVEEVRTALEALHGAQESLERVAGELIPLQEQRRSEVEEAFRSGFVDVTALLIAEQALQQSQLRRVDLEREVSTAHLRLERAVGGPAAFHAAVAASQPGLVP
jgi:cobalt-zinc-cadmium efflux system outer membrane protein